METTVVNDAARFERLLDEFGRIRGEAASPATLLEAAGYPNYENVASNLLKYFLDPLEKHGLQDLFLNALMEPLGFEGVSVQAVEREVRTSNGKFIDLLVDADAHLIGVENKIYAGLYNPLQDYLGHLEQNRSGRDTRLIVLCVHEPQQVLPPSVVVVTYEEYMGRIRRDLGSYAADVPAQYLTFALDFVKTMENRKRVHRMNPAVMELLRERTEEAKAFLVAAEDATKELRETVTRLGEIVNALLSESPEGRPTNVTFRLWREPRTFVDDALYDVNFPSGVVIRVDTILGLHGWQVFLWQYKPAGPRLPLAQLESWSREVGVPFLEQNPIQHDAVVTANFGVDTLPEDVARHTAAVVAAIARASLAPGASAAPEALP